MVISFGTVAPASALYVSKKGVVVSLLETSLFPEHHCRNVMFFFFVSNFKYEKERNQRVSLESKSMIATANKFQKRSLPFSHLIQHFYLFSFSKRRKEKTDHNHYNDQDDHKNQKKVDLSSDPKEDMFTAFCNNMAANRKRPA